MKKILLIFCLLATPIFGATRNLVPPTDGTGSIGTDTYAWSNGVYKYSLKVAGTDVLTSTSSVPYTAVAGTASGLVSGVTLTNVSFSGTIPAKDGTNVMLAGDVTTNDVATSLKGHQDLTGTAVHGLGSASTSNSTDFMSAYGGSYNLQNSFHIQEAGGGYLEFTAGTQILTLLREGNTFTFDNAGLTISPNPNGAFIGNLTGNADTATYATMSGGSSGLVSDATLTNLTLVGTRPALNGTNILIAGDLDGVTNNLQDQITTAYTNSLTNSIYIGAVEAEVDALNALTNTMYNMGSFTNWGSVVADGNLNLNNNSITNVALISLNASNANPIGKIMLPSSTSTNDGIRFGDDMTLYRTGPSSVTLGGHPTATFIAPRITMGGDINLGGSSVTNGDFLSLTGLPQIVFSNPFKSVVMESTTYPHAHVTGIKSNYVAIGNGAGYKSYGQYGISIGDSCGTNLLGNGNISFGYLAGNDQGSGAYNFSVGESARRTSVGSYNVGIGYAAQYAAYGNGNIGIGHSAGRQSSGYNNIGIGYQALFLNGSYVSNAICIGQASYVGNGKNKIAIGYGATNDLSDNSVVIGANGQKWLTITNGVITGNGSGLTNVPATFYPQNAGTYWDYTNNAGFDTNSADYCYLDLSTATNIDGSAKVPVGTTRIDLVVRARLQENVETVEKNLAFYTSTNGANGAIYLTAQTNGASVFQCGTMQITNRLLYYFCDKADWRVVGLRITGAYK